MGGKAELLLCLEVTHEISAASGFPKHTETWVVVTFPRVGASQAKGRRRSSDALPDLHQYDV